MDSPQDRCWSFPYTYCGSRYSVNIVAETKGEAENRLHAMVDAICEGEVIPYEAEGFTPDVANSQPIHG